MEQIRGKFAVVLLAFQALFLVLIGVFVDYDRKADARYKANSKDPDKGGVSDEFNEQNHLYPHFQDVHVMVFFGIAYLLSFLMRHGYSSVGFNMLFGMFTAQWWIIINGFVHGLKDGKIHIDIQSIMTADFGAATVLISYCVVLGKTSPLQMLIFAILETVVFVVNEWLGVVILQVADLGSSIFIHVFACYFGMAVTRVIYKKETLHSPKEGAVYTSDLFCMAGTIFLWLFWPTFNSANARGDNRHRAILNTYLSLAGCCLATMAISSAVNKHSKFQMVHLQNASLAGGVAVGAVADMMIMPWGATLLGVLSGVISTLGIAYVTPFFTNKLKIQDVCGVQNVHGLPGILSALASVIYAGVADFDTYGNSLYTIFPARAPEANSTALHEIQAEYGRVEAGKGRTAWGQAGYQALALVITIAVAILGGTITGFVLRLPYLDEPTGDDVFDDNAWWEVNPDSYEEALQLELCAQSVAMPAQAQSKYQVQADKPQLRKRRSDGVDGAPSAGNDNQGYQETIDLGRL